MPVIDRPAAIPDAGFMDPIDMEEDDGGMTETQFKAFLQDELQDADDFVDANIGGRRERNWDYYNLDMSNPQWGLPAAKGRSQVVDATLPSYINLMQPQLMDIMVSGRNIGEYEGDESDEQALECATDYVNNVVMRKDNRGEIILKDWCWDGLVQVVGIVKAYWKEDSKQETDVYNVSSDMELAFLIGGIESTEGIEVSAFEAGPNGYVVEVTRTIDTSHVGWESIPPEEFVINRDARNLDDAILQSHRTESTVGDMIARGYDEDAVMKLPTFDELQLETDRTERGYLTQRSRQDSVDPMMRRVAIHEGKIRCDYDGTGVKWWYFVAGGNEDVIELLDLQPFEDQIYFADFCPYPIPHTFWGRCPADDLAEIQLVKTALVRQYLDNLYLTNAPMTEVEVNSLAKGGLDALLTRAPGQLVPVKRLNATREIVTPLMAREALAGLEYFDQEAEARSGVSKESMGLNPEVLSNQSATAANLAYSQSVLKVKEIARTWANDGMRKLFVYTLRIVKRYDDFMTIVRKLGGNVKCTPEQWAAFDEFDAIVKTGLGTGSKEKDALAVMDTFNRQSAMYSDLGPNNGVITAGMIVNTARRLSELSGALDPDQCYNDVPIDWDLPQPDPQQQPPDPKMIEVQQKGMEAQAKLELERQKATANIELERAKAAEQIRVARETEAAKVETELRKIETQYALEQERMNREFALREEELEKEASLELIAIREKAASGNGQIPNER